MTLPAVAPEPSRAAVAHARLTRWAIHVPGDGDAAAVGPADAHELLGRKGLLYKEPATRLALCAVHRALGRAPRAARHAGDPDPRTAVVASSNLGNVETVTKVARTVRASSGRDVSPLDAPNASSNVVASTVAIWFGFGGPNLMVCSGATAGLDAVRLAALLLRAGRADRVVVVGSEPDDEVATALRRLRGGDGGGAGRAPARAGAAALVLERDDASGAGGAPALGAVRRAPHGAVPAGDGVLVGPAALARPGQRCIDVEARLGDLYGALGVVQVALAAGLAHGDGERPPRPVVVVGGDEHDGWRTTTVSPPAAPGGER